MNVDDLNKRLFVNDKEPWLKNLSKIRKTEFNCGYSVVRDAVILPTRGTEECAIGGVVDINGKFIAGHLRYEEGKTTRAFEIREGYAVNRDDLKHIHGTAVFGGVIKPHYGHVITDGFSRLWFKKHNFDLKYLYIFIVISHDNVAEWLYELFALAGLSREDVLIIKKEDSPVIVENLIIPEQSAILFSRYSKEWVDTYTYMAGNAVKKLGYKVLPKKIYYTRRCFDKLRSRYIVNEEYAEKFYRDHGYEVISPENYSICEQIAMAANAEAVACNLGTLSHIILFSRQGIKCDCYTVDSVFNPEQSLINEAKSADYRIVDSNMSFLPYEHVRGAMLFGITDNWKNYVKNAFNEDVTIDTSSEVIVSYIKEWAEYFYNSPFKFNAGNFNNFELYDVFSRICEIFLKKVPEKNKYNIGMSKEALKKLVASQANDINILLHEKFNNFALNCTTNNDQKWQIGSPVWIKVNDENGVLLSTDGYSTGRWVLLPLNFTMKINATYSYHIRFRVNTTAPRVRFQLTDEEKKQFVTFKSVSSVGFDWVEENGKFTADNSWVYFMITSTDLVGEGAKIEFEKIIIKELNA